MRTVRTGAGAGYSGHRIEPALELAERGRLDYLVFECLAARTIALAQAARQVDPARGFDPLLEDRLRAVLLPCVEGRVLIITNMGAANPVAAARETARLASDLGLQCLRIAAVTGDDVTGAIRGADLPLIERDGRIGDVASTMVSANAPLGAGPIVEALAAGADVVITGRVGEVFPAATRRPLDGYPDGLARLVVRDLALLARQRFDVAQRHLLQHAEDRDAGQVGRSRRRRQRQPEPDEVVRGMPDHALVEDLEIHVPVDVSSKTEVADIEVPADPDRRSGRHGTGSILALHALKSRIAPRTWTWASRALPSDRRRSRTGRLWSGAGPMRSCRL